MWVARDKDGTLAIYKYYPKRVPLEAGHGYIWCSNYDISLKSMDWEETFTIDSSLFPELKWEDEPIEVNIFSNSQIRDIITGTQSLTCEDTWISFEEIINRFKIYIRIDLRFLLNNHDKNNV